MSRFYPPDIAIDFYPSGNPLLSTEPVYESPQDRASGGGGGPTLSARLTLSQYNFSTSDFQYNLASVIFDQIGISFSAVVLGGVLLPAGTYAVHQHISGTSQWSGIASANGGNDTSVLEVSSELLVLANDTVLGPVQYQSSPTGIFTPPQGGLMDFESNLTVTNGNTTLDGLGLDAGSHLFVAGLLTGNLVGTGSITAGTLGGVTITLDILKFK